MHYVQSAAPLPNRTNVLQRESVPCYTENHIPPHPVETRDAGSASHEDSCQRNLVTIFEDRLERFQEST